MNLTPLTVIILAHTIDQKLKKALRSVNFADEIIVVDTARSLDWSELKQQYSLTIISLPGSINNFSKVRNEAMRHSKHEWVLFLDSDEELVAGAQPQIAAIIDSPANGAVFTRSDVFAGKKLEYGEAGNQKIIRFGKKSKMKFHGKVHEVARINGELAHPKITILHYAHDSVASFIADVNQYAQLAATVKQTDATQNAIEMLSYPAGKLLYGLFIQAGILDGWQGLTYAYCMALHSLLVRMYRYEILATHQKPQTTN